MERRHTHSTAPVEYSASALPGRRPSGGPNPTKKPPVKKLKRNTYVKCIECKERHKVDREGVPICNRCLQKLRKAENGIVDRCTTRPGNAYNRPKLEASLANRRHMKHRPLVNGRIRAKPTRSASATDRIIYVMGLYIGGGMADIAFSHHPFKHVRGYDCEERFRGVVEHNLNTTFEAADLTKWDPASYPIKLRDDL